MMTTAPHVIAETSIPNFLLKLWKLVEDDQFNNCIHWDATGFSFHISEPHVFSKDVLPLYFKHSNLNSFVRQLNMYGFRKVTNLEKGSMKPPPYLIDTLEFQHPYFIKGHPELLQFIKRKISNPRGAPMATTLSSTEFNDNAIDEDDIKPIPLFQQPQASSSNYNQQQYPTSSISSTSRDMNQILNEVRNLREKQHGMDAKLNNVKKENQTLWREVIHLRQTHMKQQDVVNKLIRFLVGLVQQTGSSSNPLSQGLGMSAKQNLFAIKASVRDRDNSSSWSPQLSANDSYVLPSRAKRARLVSSESLNIIDPLSQHLLVETSPSFIKTKHQGGPIIADVTNEIDNISHFGGSHDHQEVDDIYFLDSPDAVQQPRPSSNVGANVQLSPGGSGGPIIGEDVQMGETAVDRRLISDNDEASASKRKNDITTASAVYHMDNSLLPQTVSKNEVYSNGQPTLIKEFSPPQLSDHLEFVQSDLDALKDFLTSESFHMDQDALNNLFRLADEANNEKDTGHSAEEIVGNELQLYKPPEILIPPFNTFVNTTPTNDVGLSAPLPNTLFDLNFVDTSTVPSVGNSTQLQQHSSTGSSSSMYAATESSVGSPGGPISSQDFDFELPLTLKTPPVSASIMMPMKLDNSQPLVTPINSPTNQQYFVVMPDKASTSSNALGNNQSSILSTVVTSNANGNNSRHQRQAKMLQVKVKSNK